MNTHISSLALISFAGCFNIQMTHPNGQPSMKDKKTLNFLKAEIIIKMIDHSVSLVKKKKKLQDMF